jgi:ankyrin repeat protein
MEFILGETPLHIAIFYDDISSVQLLIKHGVDVNQRVFGSFYSPGQNRNKYETKTGRKNRTSRFFEKTNTSQKLISLKNANPESIFEIVLL